MHTHALTDSAQGCEQGAGGPKIGQKRVSYGLGEKKKCFWACGSGLDLDLALLHTRARQFGENPTAGKVFRTHPFRRLFY